jgi:hypothetical protein
MYLQFHIYKNIPVSFNFLTTWNQGVFLWSSSIKRQTINIPPARQLFTQLEHKQKSVNIFGAVIIIKLVNSLVSF